MTTLREAWHRDGEHDRETAEAHATPNMPTYTEVAYDRYEAAVRAEHEAHCAVIDAERQVRHAKEQHDLAVREVHAAAQAWQRAVVGGEG